MKQARPKSSFRTINAIRSKRAVGLATCVLGMGAPNASAAVTAWSVRDVWTLIAFPRYTVFPPPSSVNDVITGHGSDSYGSSKLDGGWQDYGEADLTWDLVASSQGLNLTFASSYQDSSVWTGSPPPPPDSGGTGSGTFIDVELYRFT